MFSVVLYNLCKGFDNLESEFNGALRVRLNSFYTAKVEQSSRENSAFQCSHRCLQRERCISMVYCCGVTAKGRCYLYNHGVAVGDTTSLVRKQGCTFYQFADIQVSMITIYIRCC